MSDFDKTLRSGKVLVMDGAMGTEIGRVLNVPSAECCESYLLSAPRLVRSIHTAYLDAGADVLLTNTFQANPAALARRGLDARFHELWQTAIELAHIDHPRRHFVLADIGPFEPVSAETAQAIVAECVDVDGLLLETWSSLDSLRWFVDRPLPASLPLLISFTFQRTSDLMTFTGAKPEQCALAAKQSGATALGANCGRNISMTDLLEIVKRYRSVCELPIFIKPNAGSPGKKPRSPAAMAAELPALLEAGVAMIGGCCGTTPEHIRAVREVVDAWNVRKPAPAVALPR